MKRMLILAGALGAIAIASGIASATIPDAGGVIHGCYNTKSGVLRVIDYRQRSAVHRQGNRTRMESSRATWSEG
jgi:hypothetical protein